MLIGKLLDNYVSKFFASSNVSLEKFSNVEWISSMKTSIYILHIVHFNLYA